MDDAVWKQTWGEALNQQQAAAVQAADGPVLLLAVPGSGKTTVLIHRLGYLMDCRGIPPERILTVTYTVAATRDMRARFARTFGEDRASRLEFRTINGPFRPDHSVLRAGHGPAGFSAGHRRGDPPPPWWENCSGRALGSFATESTTKGLRSRHHLTERTGRCPGRRWRRCPPGNCLWPRFIRPIAGCSGSGAGWTMTIRWCTRRRFSGGMGRFWPTFRKNTPISVWMRPRIPPHSAYHSPSAGGKAAKPLFGGG